MKKYRFSLWCLFSCLVLAITSAFILKRHLDRQTFLLKSEQRQVLEKAFADICDEMLYLRNLQQVLSAEFDLDQPAAALYSTLFKVPHLESLKISHFAKEQSLNMEKSDIFGHYSVNWRIDTPERKLDWDHLQISDHKITGRLYTPVQNKNYQVVASLSGSYKLAKASHSLKKLQEDHPSIIIGLKADLFDAQKSGKNHAHANYSLMKKALPYTRDYELITISQNLPIVNVLLQKPLLLAALCFSLLGIFYQIKRIFFYPSLRQ